MLQFFKDFTLGAVSMAALHASSVQAVLHLLHIAPVTCCVVPFTAADGYACINVSLTLDGETEGTTHPAVYIRQRVSDCSFRV